MTGHVVEHQFGGGRAFDAHLVLDAADGHTAVGTVEDKVGEATAVGSAFLTAGENQMNIGIAVGDETFHAIETPAVGCFVKGGPQTDGLEVAAGIGFGEVHGAGGTVLDAGQELLLKLFRSKLLDGVSTILKTPDGGEADIGAGDDFGSHDGNDAGHVEATETTFEGHAIEA